MLKFLWKLIVVGFPQAPKCQHKFGLWELLETKSNSHGEVKHFQGRRCQECGLHQFRVDEVG